MSDENIKKLEMFIKRGPNDWMDNDSTFDGFRNTPARILIFFITTATLYGVGVWAFLDNSQTSLWIYAASLLSVIGMQKLSVRNVFHNSRNLDEYQTEKRNRAYRTAYRRIFQILATSIASLAFGRFLSVGDSVTIELSQRQTFIYLIFICALFILQKYISWGFNGEPWQDTARKKV